MRGSNDAAIFVHTSYTAVETLGVFILGMALFLRAGKGGGGGQRFHTVTLPLLLVTICVRWRRVAAPLRRWLGLSNFVL